MADEPTTQESVEGQAEEGITLTETPPEDQPERKPGLEEAFAEHRDAPDRAAADEGEVEEPEAAAREPEPDTPDETTGEETPDEAAVRYRDPESGQFISAEEARSRGLEPEELTTEAEAAEEFFGEGEEPDGDEEELEGESLRFEVPTEGEDDEPVAYDLEGLSPEAREYLETQLGRAERVEELEQQRVELREERRNVEESLEALEKIETRLEVDPVGFMSDNIPDDRRAEVAVDLLLTSDAVYDHVVDKLNEWERNPERRETDKYKRKSERVEEMTTAERRRKANRARQQKGREIVEEIERLAPDDMSRTMRQRFIQDASRDLQEYLRRNPMEPDEFDMDEIPELLSERMAIYGIEPDTRTNGARGDGPRQSEPADEETQSMAERAEHARQVGERLRKARARKVDAASTAPAGAGSVPDRGAPGPDATLDEMLDYHRQVGA